MNWNSNPLAQNVGGYIVSSDKTNCPIFVNYHKEEGISESTKYEDKFVNAKEFDWMSKSNRKIDSKDVQSILGKNGVIKLPLFVKKNNDFIRRFTAGVKVVEIDALGRLLVPKDLVIFASISKDVVFSSAVNIVEIWDKDLYEKSIDGQDVDFADLAEDVMGNTNDDNGIS